MSKKIFIISGVIFVLAGLFLAVLKFMPEKKTEVISEKNQEQKEDNKESEKDNNSYVIKKLIEGDIRGATFNQKDKSIVYYNNNNFLKSRLDGEGRVSILAYPFEKITKIVWSKDADKALVEDTGAYFVCDFTESRTNQLDSRMKNIVFNSAGNKLIYEFHGERKSNISVSDLAGGNYEEIREAQYKYTDFSANPKNEKFLIYPSPWALEKTKAELFDPQKKESKLILSEKFGADYLWSPDGKKILVSHTLDSDKSKMSLAVMNEEGGEFSGLNFPTFVEKCVWSKDNVNVYCAMISGFPSSALLPNDWTTGKYQSVDTFWKINTSNGKKERVIDLADLNEEIDSFSLFLDEEENYLFFVNKKDGDLYRISLL